MTAPTVQPWRFASERIAGMETDGKTASRWKPARLMCSDRQIFSLLAARVNPRTASCRPHATAGLAETQSEAEARGAPRAPVPAPMQRRSRWLEPERTAGIFETLWLTEDLTPGHAGTHTVHLCDVRGDTTSQLPWRRWATQRQWRAGNGSSPPVTLYKNWTKWLLPLASQTGSTRWLQWAKIHCAVFDFFHNIFLKL